MTRKIQLFIEKMDKWTIIDTGKASAEMQMAYDASVLTDLTDHQKPILRFYEWTVPSITYGHFLDPFKYLNQEALIKHSMQLAKRPTGGGIIFHVFDFPFSVIIPSSHPGYTTNTLSNYRMVNQRVSQAIKCFLNEKIDPELLENDIGPFTTECESFCMAKPTIYDVMIDGRKVYGGAQRRTKKGFLHQGTISLTVPSSELLNEVLSSHPALLDAMSLSSGSLLGPNPTLPELKAARTQLKALLKHALCS
jgi:lipoate-protein ligase A